MNSEETKNIPAVEEGTTTLTDDQIEDIAQQMDESIKGTQLEDLANMPSNQGKLDRSEEERKSTPGEFKNVKVTVNPETGEHSVIGSAETTSDSEKKETFEEMIENFEDIDIEATVSAPVTSEELKSYIDNDTDGVMKEIYGDTAISDEAVKKLLEIVNRKMKNEKFNIYTEFPDEIKQMVNKYITDGGIPLYSDKGKQFRKFISESLIDEFITNISIDRVQHDFSKELEELFERSFEEISDTIIGYTTERNKVYREYAEKLEDEEKKKKILEILDQIDEAYNLNKMKEFAVSCKIKSIELDKPNNRIYDSFLDKYKNSSYNIYDIKLAREILFRNLSNKYPEMSVTIKDIDGFFICFCKQCLNMSPEKVLDHAYMYYVLDNIVLIDINKGASSEVSDKFLENVKEVVDILRSHNPKLVEK